MRNANIVNKVAQWVAIIVVCVFIYWIMPKKSEVKSFQDMLADQQASCNRTCENLKVFVNSKVTNLGITSNELKDIKKHIQYLENQLVERKKVEVSWTFTENEEELNVLKARVEKLERMLTQLRKPVAEPKKEHSILVKKSVHNPRFIPQRRIRIWPFRCFCGKH
jgi:hypothetical protein